MRTYTANLMAEHGWMVGMGVGATYAGKGRAATAAKRETGVAGHVKNVALFLAAPFIGLAYLLAFPFVGFALLAWIGIKAVMKNEKARPVAIAIAAPFLGLAFVTVGPIAGLAALGWIGARAVLKTA